MDGQGYGEPQFGRVAALYDAIRPGYPRRLIDTVLDRSAAGRAGTGRAIEVGAGTGQATRAFAARGIEVTAVEPDPSMAALLRLRCADLPQVTVRGLRFEAVRERGFSLLFSAQAWHWTDPAVRWDQAAAVVRAGGTLALFWNFDRIAEPALQSAVTAVHERHTPEIRWDTDPVDEAGLDGRWPGNELASRSDFTEVTAQLFRWRRTLPRDGYLDYLATHSAYLRLDADTRRTLFVALAAVLPDRVRLAEDSVLYLATRTAG